MRRVITLVFASISLLVFTIDAFGIVGGETSLLPSGTLRLSRFSYDRFEPFVENAIRAFFSVANDYKLVSRSAIVPFISDVEITGKSICLDNRSRGTWQRLRFEVIYIIDPDSISPDPNGITYNVRYALLIRLLSGEFADFSRPGEPPAGRINELSPSELTDIASRFTSFLGQEVTRDCFDKVTLTLCPNQKKVSCQ